jgi:hypothetical protein
LERLSRGILVVAVITMASTPLIAQGTPAKGRLVVESERVQIADIEPGSRWVLMAFGRELSSPVSVRGYFQWHELEDRGRSGKIDLDLADKPTPRLSIWAAFEVASGQLLVARPNGVQLAPNARSLQDAQSISMTDLASAEALIFLLRRGDGAWVWTAESDSGSFRADGPEVRPADFIPVVSDSAAQTPLDDFRSDDLLLAINQQTLALTVSRVR